jgi:hypothetical protein
MNVKLATLILRSAPQERASKDVSGGTGDSWNILRDGRSRGLLRMRAERMRGFEGAVLSTGSLRRCGA